MLQFSEGSGGGYVEATFNLPVGDTLQIIVGGGGMSAQSQSHSLGGKGGYHGGLPGRQDEMSGGGGSGGLTTISWNGTVIAAAYGGDGGGNTTYCTALGGLGAILRGVPKNDDNAGGYINFHLALPDNGLEEEMVCPGVPAIDVLSHDSATFTWSAGSHRHERSKELYVQKYTVQSSLGEDSEGSLSCSEDYKLHEHIQRNFDVTQHATTSLSNLKSSTRYCIRIEAFSIEGLSLGVQELPFTTKATPINEWVPVTVRHLEASSLYEANVDNGQASSWCEHSSTRPTGRRGHSMTIINDQVYIFGGATLKCVCKFDESLGQRQCSTKNIYSDEFWHFDPRTAMFTQLKRASKEDPWPRGREQHSATVLPNGNIIVMGGMTSANDELEIGEDYELLADVWQIRDPHHISSHEFRGKDVGEMMQLELIPGRVTSHEISVSLNDDEKMCIDNIQFEISLDHGCLKGIEYIKLTGPGTKHMVDHDAPQSRDYETKVFVSNMESRGKECEAASLNLLFSDDATESVLSYASIPSGTFRPASSLMATFGGLPINGEWKVSIALSQYPEEYIGRVLNWGMRIDAKTCVAHPTWEKLSMPPSSFSRRRHQTAVAVDASIFVAGGFAERRLNDLWRFDYDSNTWTELNSADRGQSPLTGQVSFLGQFGLLAFGGIAKYGPQERGRDLWLLDLFEDDWVPVPIPQNASVNIGLLRNNGKGPGSIKSNGKGPMALVFGGDGGLLHNAYADSYGFMPNSFFDDVWLLSPGRIGISSTMARRSRHDYCDWRWIPGSTSHRIWNNTCGWDDA
ncbi:hypothetical protein ACHAXR_003909, partial [Thalassiosira sp. AJA248-18]